MFQPTNMAFPCDHKTHGPYRDLQAIESSTMPVRTCIAWPHHLRSDRDTKYQNCMIHIIEKEDHGYCCIMIEHLTNPAINATIFPCFCYPIVRPHSQYEKTYGRRDALSFEKEAVLIDEVDKKLYFIHYPIAFPNFVIRQFSFDIFKIPNGQRVIGNLRLFRAYLGRFDFSTRMTQNTDVPRNSVEWFLNPFDGNIYFLFHYYISAEPSVTSSFVVHWLKLDDTVKIEVPSGIEYDGKVKVISECKFEFNKFTMVEPNVIFGKNGQNLLLRFRIPHPDSIDLSDDGTEIGRKVMDSFSDIQHDHPYVAEMIKPPAYVLLGLDYKPNKIDVLAQFNPTSYEHHCDLLISSRLLAKFGDYIGFPESKSISFLSQRTEMIGQFLKYTFFSTLHKQKMTILAVKSVANTLQNRKMSLTPKKLWFPLEDEKFKEEFQKLSQLINWDMLTQKENVFFVRGREFVLKVSGTVGNRSRHLATIRIKLGDEYKDYRTCAGCGEVEKYKRRNKSGKRMSQFKVCGWCKDNNLHKLWWERPCHYCSAKCADDHWPVHRLEHEQPIKFKISKEKKKKKKK